MENKIKFIIIGLIAILSLSLFINLIFYGNNKTLQRKALDLERENVSLNKTVQKHVEEKRSLDERIKSLNTDLENITREKDELGKRLEQLQQEREGLIKRLKEQRSFPPAEARPQAAEDAYWAGILKTKANLEVQVEILRNELKSIQITNEELQREKGVRELELNNLKREMGDSKQQLDYNQRLADSLTQELVLEKNHKFEIQQSLKELKGESTTLRRQLSSLINRKANLERELQKTKEENTSLERRLTEMDTILKDQSSKANALRQQLDVLRSGGKLELPKSDTGAVQLPPIVVRPQSEPSIEEPVLPTISGKVVAINKDNNFVIIDLGSDMGIKEGDRFQVYRAGKGIADIEVIQTRRSISACDIKRQTTAIRTEDIVR